MKKPSTRIPIESMLLALLSLGIMMLPLARVRNCKRPPEGHPGESAFKFQTKRSTALAL